MTTTTTFSSETASTEDPQSAVHAGFFGRGDVLGRYEILFPLATGGMASVYAARLLGDGLFQKPVAIKVMLPHLAQDERFVAMFIDEAALAAQVQSPHVVQVIELGRHGASTLFIAMDLVVGVSLRQVFDRMCAHGGKLPLSVLCTVLIQAATGLHDAHEACAAGGERLGIVHRDISPHNVLIGVDGRARITDFGIARAFERISATQTGELKGKLPYFSPEQVRCVDLDARSDVFSLGIVAWEMLAAERLFDAPNPLATAQAVAAKPVPRLDVIRPHIPKGVADVIERALARDPEQRLPSAEAFARGLRDACLPTCGLAEGREVGAALRELCGAQVSAVEDALAQAMAMRTGPHPAMVRSTPRGRARLWPFILFAILFVSSAGGLWALRQDAPEVPRPAASEPRPQPAGSPVEPVQPMQPTPSIPSVAPAEAVSAELDAGITPDGGVAPSKVDAGAQRRSRVKNTRRKIRRAAPDKASETIPNATPREPLLRKIEEFDREREK